jgi:hypothetical protein
MGKNKIGWNSNGKGMNIPDTCKVLEEENEEFDDFLGKKKAKTKDIKFIHLGKLL